MAQMHQLLRDTSLAIVVQKAKQDIEQIQQQPNSKSIKFLEAKKDRQFWYDGAEYSPFWVTV